MVPEESQDPGCLGRFFLGVRPGWGVDIAPNNCSEASRRLFPSRKGTCWSGFPRYSLFPNPTSSLGPSGPVRDLDHSNRSGLSLFVPEPSGQTTLRLQILTSSSPGSRTSVVSGLRAPVLVCVPPPVLFDSDLTGYQDPSSTDRPPPPPPLSPGPTLRRVRRLPHPSDTQRYL